MATPGTYTVNLSKRVDGLITQLAPAREFEVVPLRKGALPGASYEEIEAFRNRHFDFQRDLAATKNVLDKDLKMVNSMKSALDKSAYPNGEIYEKLAQIRADLLDLDERLNGNRTKAEIGEAAGPTPGLAEYVADRALKTSTYGPTGTHKAALELGMERLQAINAALRKIDEESIPELKTELIKSGAPWIEGQGF